MNFEKGNQFGKGSSRKGKPNKATNEVRKSFQSLIENNVEQMQADLLGISAEARLNVLLKLATFILPRLQAVEIEATHSGFENSELINKLLKIDESEYE
jgi:hypothetical protein